MSQGNQPVIVFTSGKISMSVFLTQGQQGEFYTVSLSKNFQRNGKWERGTSFAASDIPDIMAVTVEAQVWAGQARRNLKRGSHANSGSHHPDSNGNHGNHRGNPRGNQGTPNAPGYYGPPADSPDSDYPPY